MNHETFSYTILLSLLLIAFIGIYIYFLYMLQQRVTSGAEDAEYVEETETEDMEEVTENSVFRFSSGTPVSEVQKETTFNDTHVEVEEIKKTSDDIFDMELHNTALVKGHLQQTQHHFAAHADCVTFENNGSVKTTTFQVISKLHQHEQAQQLCV